MNTNTFYETIERLRKKFPPAPKLEFEEVQGHSGGTWYIPTNIPNRADGIHYKIDDITSHSNCLSLLSDTGIDITNECYTAVAIFNGDEVVYEDFELGYFERKIPVEGYRITVSTTGARGYWNS